MFLWFLSEKILYFCIANFFYFWLLIFISTSKWSCSCFFRTVAAMWGVGNSCPKILRWNVGKCDHSLRQKKANNLSQTSNNCQKLLIIRRVCPLATVEGCDFIIQEDVSGRMNIFLFIDSRKVCKLFWAWYSLEALRFFSSLFALKLYPWLNEKGFLIFWRWKSSNWENGY